MECGILCDFLTVMGLRKKEDGAYGVTEPGTRYLDRASPAWIGGAIDFFAAPEMLSLVLDDPASYVRRGGSSGLAYLAPDHPIWLRYAKAVTPIARVTAKRAAAHLANRLSPPTSVLDDAVGHGFYGIKLARRSILTEIQEAPICNYCQCHAARSLRSQTAIEVRSGSPV